MLTPLPGPKIPGELMSSANPLRALALTAAAALCLAPAARADHFRLFVLTGQSNALGTTAGGETDPSPGTDPADALVPFFWSNRADASTLLGDSAAKWLTLRAQQGGYYSGSSTHWGPEIAFGRTLVRAGIRNAALIKACRGGGGNSFWLKSSTDPHMYRHVVDTVTSATDALTASGHTFEITGLLYLQGESDSPAEAEAAGTRLRTLVENLRSDLPNATHLHAVAAGIAAAGNTRDTVRTQQTAAATQDPALDTFANLDLQPALYDALHFNRAAKLVVGARFAHAFFHAKTLTPHYGNLVCIGDSITQGGNGDHPSFRYRLFHHLTTLGVPNDPDTGYQFAGSLNGAWKNDPVTTPPINSLPFDNTHEGHYGWRASWLTGRVPLPASRYQNNNLGSGNLLNWTGQTTTFTTADAGSLTYTGPTYRPDTAIILAGVNDLADATAESQVRDDLGTLIDQLRTANPNVRIFLNRILPTNQSATLTTRINQLNDLLPALVTSRNTAAPNSPVWLVDAASSFNPTTQTYDKLHPNAAGEIHLGDHLAAAIGLIETPGAAQAAATPPPPNPREALDSSQFRTRLDPYSIFDGSIYQNGWFQSGNLTKSIDTSGNLRLVNPGSGGTWIEGTSGPWISGNTQSWTFETRLKFNNNPNGFVLWLGTGTKRIIIELLANGTRDFNNDGFSVSHNNTDGDFHTFRICHDAIRGRYHVWRDNTRLTPLDGVPYDATATDNRLILGDYTSSTFGNNFDVTLSHVRYDTSGAWLPPAADIDNDGLPDAWEYRWFGSFTAAHPQNDEDGDGRTNLQEAADGSNPWDPQSNSPVTLTATTSQSAKEIPRLGSHILLQLRLTNHTTTPRTLDALTIDLTDNTNPAHLASLSLHSADAAPTEPPAITPAIATITPTNRSWTLSPNLTLPPGNTYLWLQATPHPNAPLGATLDAAISSLTIDGSPLEPDPSSPPGALTLALTPVFTDVRISGENGVNTYRIPGITSDSNGILHAVYDHRYANSSDLPANVDVGYSRSTDGGLTWSASQIILDFDASVPNSSGNGVGDPCILHDPVTDTLWVAALWSFGNNGYNGSGAGTDPATTGQYVLTKSNDGGATWSPPINITTSVKDDPNWRLVFQGPGHGLAMRNGTLVFPSQRINASGVVQACSVFSTDHGTTWDFGSAIPTTSPTTNENTVCELDDGRLLFSMRTPSGSNGQRAWAHYTPGGNVPMRNGSWSPLYRLASVPDPVCQGSVIQWQSKLRGHPRELIAYVGPGTSASRTNLTLRISNDGGLTWPVSRLIYPGSSAYSALCVLPDLSIGVLFERDDYRKITFVRIDPDWIFDPTKDTDADGMPDDWETLHGVSQPDADDDRDGRSNHGEYLDGTNPLDPASILRAVSLAPDAQQTPQFSWQSVPGRLYQVESSDDLITWETQSNYRATHTLSTVPLPPAPHGRRFARARMLR